MGDKAGLGHRTLRRVDEQNDAVHHFEHTLHLAAEVGVAGGVDQIDLGILISNCCVFGENCNAALPFEVVRVHDSLLNHLIFTIGAALLEHLVDKGSFAVVNVRDDGNIS